VAVVIVLALSSAASAAKTPYQVEFESFSFASGTTSGTVASGAGLTLAAGVDTGTWTSPWHDPGFAFSQAVASWNASTPAHTWIQVELRARKPDATETKWYVMGRWAYGDSDFHRTSVPGQGDKDASIAIDTFIPKKPMLAYQLRRRSTARPAAARRRP
jgi:hypothetical protein